MLDLEGPVRVQVGPGGRRGTAVQPPRWAGGGGRLGDTGVEAGAQGGELRPEGNRV